MPSLVSSPVRPRRARWASRAAALLTAAVGVAAAACNTGPKFSFSAPAVAPEVNKALPTSLQAASTGVSAARIPVGGTGPSYDVTASAKTEVLGYVTNLFQANYLSQSSGVTVQGYVNSLVISVDSRLAILSQELTGYQANKPPSCLSAPAQSYTIDLSQIDPMLKLTLPQVQCLDALPASGDTIPAIPGVGLIYGQSNAGTGSSYSMWLSLVAWNPSIAESLNTWSHQGGVIVAANLQNYGSTSASSPEQVDGMLIVYSPPAIGNRLTATRFKATPSAHTFELFIASSSPDIGLEATGSTHIYIGAGFRMISDGTYVYADGLMWDPTNAPAGWQPFTLCMVAASLSVDATPSDCTTLSGSFTLSSSASLTYAEVTGSGLTGANIPGPTSKTATTPPTAAVLTLLNAAYPITNASGVTTVLNAGTGGNGGG